ncbi:MAG: PorP/SprF family type IX secretion system membrane protein [Chitinophagaceae bacterium]|nr:PorP/SprF family type IX secretion system membrane protein [Chitinophagaceae bacterium]MCW5925359.1 PorP/SprF family type IX secretion system membrane protein [Chitinophagaceae bacterium]
MKKILFVAMGILTLNYANAQDPHFSQFFSSPLTLNPAYTGKFDGSFRVAGNYRNQWPTINNAYRTATLSADFGILQNRIPVFDTWGVGIMAMNDQSADRILNNNYIALSTAYHKALDENGYHVITVGFQGTYANKRLDITRAKFEDMLRADGFTGTTQEDFSNNTRNIVLNYADMNAGVMYSGSTNDNNNFYVGISSYHINRPSESFMGGNYVLNSRLTVHGGGYLPVAYRTTFHTSFIHQRQAGARETVIGGAFDFALNEDEDLAANLYAGAWYRFKDAVIPYIGIEFAGIRIGYSYDINSSSLSTASNRRGGNEISLIYIKKPSDPGRKKLNCPKF